MKFYVVLAAIIFFGTIIGGSAGPVARPQQGDAGDVEDDEVIIQPKEAKGGMIGLGVLGTL